ncbi:MAG: hypothetical protein HGN29_00835 [Asgard group archaeon]|nr:hypothetical protein [Asgard group archaeon]
MIEEQLDETIQGKVLKRNIISVFPFLLSTGLISSFIVILFKERIADLWLFALIGSLSVLVLIVSA